MLTLMTASKACISAYVLFQIINQIASRISSSATDRWSKEETDVRFGKWRLHCTCMRNEENLIKCIVLYIAVWALGWANHAASDSHVMSSQRSISGQFKLSKGHHIYKESQAAFFSQYYRPFSWVLNSDLRTYTHAVRVLCIPRPLILILFVVFSYLNIIHIVTC